MKFNETQPGCWYRRICDGQILMPLFGKNRFVTPAGVWYNEVPEGDFIRCNQDGSDYTPKPAVGQVWANQFGDEFRIHAVSAPNGKMAYCGAYNNGGISTSLESLNILVIGCTFLRDK
jgi:hypothetical protein